MLCVVFTQAFAEDVSYVALEKTPLKLKYTDKNDVAYFSGQIAIEGNYEVTYDSWDAEKLEIHVSFYPTEKSANQLPFPTNNKHSDNYPPQELILTNSKQAARLLLSESENKKLMSDITKFDQYTQEQKTTWLQNFMPFKGFARIKIANYSTAVDCDSRWYSARLLAVMHKSKELVDNYSGQSPC